MEASTRKTIDALNLASVQRIDPCAVSIIDRCTYASLYSYAKNEGWQKTEIEGPMLVYRRADHPTHSFIIANRHSRQDFIEPISATLQLCLKSSYIMMKKPEGNLLFKFKSGEDMPAMLQKLLCEERQLPRGRAVSADQVEKQLLFDQAAKQKNTEPLKKFVAEPTITSNFSCMRCLFFSVFVNTSILVT
uniref:tRNA_int_endo domain-containing protein n=1 Tax=Syphacia muris TaxID=451379 RepID=A0A0N5AR01_9BILA